MFKTKHIVKPVNDPPYRWTVYYKEWWQFTWQPTNTVFTNKEHAQWCCDVLNTI